MSYSQQRLAQFTQLLSSKYDLTAIQDDMARAFLDVVKTPQPDMVFHSKVKKTPTVKKSKKKSGYTLFLSQTMTGGKVIMGDAVKMWRELTEDQKTEWKNEAKEVNEANEVNETKEVNEANEVNETKEVNEENNIEGETEVVEKKEKKEKKWNGYTLFISTKMKNEKLKRGVVAAQWKPLTKEEKDEWNEKAKEENNKNF
jgi:hypothetical protein